MLVSTFSMAYRAEQTQSDAASWRLVEVSSFCCKTEQHEEIQQRFSICRPDHNHQTAKQDSHQDLEEDHEQLVTGHEVTV